MYIVLYQVKNSSKSIVNSFELFFIAITMLCNISWQTTIRLLVGGQAKINNCFRDTF